MTLEQRRALVEPGLKGMSVVRQCDVLEIHRSGFYYTPRPMCEEDLRIMRLMPRSFIRGNCIWRIPAGAHAGWRMSSRRGV